MSVGSHVRPVCMYRPREDAECLPCNVRFHRTYGPPWACRFEEGGWQAFGAPRGILFLHNASKANASLNAELGTDHALLPVTHTHTSSDSLVVGLWFYYARGCSDAAWPMGRTLLVRNRCHAAVAVHQRANPRRSGPRSWDHAVAQVAAALAAASRKLAITGLERIRNISALSEALDECARGDLSEMRLGPLVLAQHNALDYVTAALLRSLRGSLRHLDTIQMHRQPQGSLPLRYATEIWDVRNLRAPTLGLPISDRPQLTWLNGSVCPLAPTWASCLACNGSMLQLACSYRCSMYRPLQTPRAQLISEAPGCVNKGQLQVLPSYGGYFVVTTVRRRLADLGPAGISVAWATPPCQDPVYRCSSCGKEVGAARRKNPGAFTAWTEQVAALEPGFQGFDAPIDDASAARKQAVCANGGAEKNWRRYKCWTGVL